MMIQAGITFIFVYSISLASAQFPGMLSEHEKLREDIKKSFHEGYQAALQESLSKNSNEKRYDIATLNQAARNRNPLLSSYGGDPYGMGSTMLSKQHIKFGKKKRSLGIKIKRHINSMQNALKDAYTSGYKAGKEMIAKIRKENSEKRFSLEKLNHAARHRNVYLDAVGGDPYGGSSVVSSQQHISWSRGKRSTSHETQTI
ncbi:uncharacterized protein LOC124439068 [Xenia sp. Carnegie-2017]|uniref:uncharacterized protein LOC124439068 n=1 Tax=Xenia sp. Carnegie-2017 TaxID=2897299 RepID=UPI001F037098|nr:uncharacterized protein LOC124439068 [Xenia sp. Carnegie-2017]